MGVTAFGASAFSRSFTKSFGHKSVKKGDAPKKSIIVEPSNLVVEDEVGQ